MSKVKIYGPAPEPTDPKELLLAQLLQNAGAREVDWCQGAFWIDELGVSTSEPASAAQCCALGAAYFEPDSTITANNTHGVIVGNDWDTANWSISECFPDSDFEDVGYAFREAMTRTEEGTE